MARPKEHEYEQTEFAKHIVELQQKHGYSDQYVVDNIVNENNATLIGNVQTYGSYKSGKRKNPRDFDDVLERKSTRLKSSHNFPSRMTSSG